jgi:excisionase family DNA binding protein
VSNERETATTVTKLFLSRREVAETFGISVPLVDKMLAAGDLDSCWLGRRRLIPATAVADLHDRLHRSMNGGRH